MIQLGQQWLFFPFSFCVYVQANNRMMESKDVELDFAFHSPRVLGAL